MIKGYLISIRSPRNPHLAFIPPTTVAENAAFEYIGNKASTIPIIQNRPRERPSTSFTSLEWIPGVGVACYNVGIRLSGLEVGVFVSC